MTPSSIFLLQAFVIVAAPVVLLRVSGLKGLLPLVVVQIMVGIGLGPSVLGRLAPDYFQMFTSPEMLSSLSGLASVGVLFFGLISGLHLDPGVFNGKERAFWPVAAANIAVPVTLGCLAGAWILTRHPDELLPGVNPAEFMAAIGICATMNALPVLGAILGEMGLLGSRVGNLALGGRGRQQYRPVDVARNFADRGGNRPFRRGTRIAADLPHGPRPGLSVPGGSLRAAPVGEDGDGPDAGWGDERPGARGRRRGDSRLGADHRTDGTALHHRRVPCRGDHPGKVARADPRPFAGGDGRVADAILLHLDRHAHPDRPGLAGVA